ncbi:hypothetical protein BpHYR1_009291, partial [Brachionus plicatilis]
MWNCLASRLRSVKNWLSVLCQLSVDTVNVRRTYYILGDRVWLLDSAKKKGLSKKLSRKWVGPFTVVEPDKKGRNQLVHANRLKKCFSPPINVRYDSLIENSESFAEKGPRKINDGPPEKKTDDSEVLVSENQQENLDFNHVVEAPDG